MVEPSSTYCGNESYIGHLRLDFTQSAEEPLFICQIQVEMAVDETGQQAALLAIDKAGVRAAPIFGRRVGTNKYNLIAAHGDRLSVRVSGVGGEDAGVVNE